MLKKIFTIFRKKVSPAHPQITENISPTPRENNRLAKTLLRATDSRDYLLIANAINNATSDSLYAAVQNIETLKPEFFLFVAEAHNQIPYLTLINKLTPEVLSRIVHMKFSCGHLGDIPLLHTSATKFDQMAFLAIIYKLSPDNLITALQLKGISGDSTLHLAANHDNSSAFISIIDKLTPESLIKLLMVKNDHGDIPMHNTPVHKSTWRFDKAAFSAICHKLLPEDLSTAMQERDVWGCTPLELLISSKQKQCILDLTDIIDPGVVLKLIPQTRNNNDPLRLFVANAFFCEEDSAIRRKFITDKTILILATLIWGRITQGGQLLVNLELRTQMLSALMGKTTILNDLEINLFHYLKKTTMIPDEIMSKWINDHLANQTSTEIYGLWQKTSFNSKSDPKYRLALNLAHEQINLKRLLPTTDLNKKIQNNEILIKIVTPDRYDDYLKQLGDYNYRPKLRREIIDPKFKFVHLTGKVVSYQYHAQKNKPPYTHTKKSSMTLIGSHLKTPVFGQHDLSRPQVGYFFSTNDCIIKAMLSEDKGTYRHQWLAQTEAEAEKAAHLAPDYNFTDFELFCQTVNNTTFYTNEPLVKAKKEAIVAIVVARNVPASIAIAKVRQQDAFDKLGINVPIVFYDAEQGTVDMIQEKFEDDIRRIDAGRITPGSGPHLYK